MISGARKAGNSVTFKDQSGFRTLCLAVWMKDYTKRQGVLKTALAWKKTTSKRLIEGVLCLRLHSRLQSTQKPICKDGTSRGMEF